MKFGYVDVERFCELKRLHPNLRITLDGEDITRLCRWVNDETGEAEVLVLSSAGQTQLTTNNKGLWTKVVCGKIEFVGTNDVTQFVCSVCSREADIGHVCWWCGYKP